MEDKVTYKITKGLIFMLAGLANHTKKEVWCQLAEETQVCVERIKKNYEKKGQTESWRHFTYPGTDITMKIKIYRQGGPQWDWQTKKEVILPVGYIASIILDKTGEDKFTSQQVADFLIEEILLGSEAVKELHE